ncbi:hypothetical protein [Myxosarcina sp. GI1]|uniref:hypothetical protein n=1 Tax=Myxosarcina sp. GI1 TaxID=1541065 RepID=UPI0012E0744A|nr:hypothetical protein [Myxosarcina sp. GI1]
MDLHTRRTISLIIQNQCYKGFKADNPCWCAVGEAFIDYIMMMSGSELSPIELIMPIMIEIYGETETLAYLKYIESYDYDRSKRNGEYEKFLAT